MYSIFNRIFCIPEIEAIIFDYLDPVKDLKNVAATNHYYHNIMSNNREYVEIRDFCFAKVHTTDTIFMTACGIGNIYTAKYIHRCKNIDHDELSEAFRLSCQNGHLEVAQWLTTLCTSYQLIIIDNKIVSHVP